MVFSSLTFLCIFLPAVIMLNAVFRSIKFRNALLIIASLLFYAYGEPIYVFIMIGSTIFNGLISLLINSNSNHKLTKNKVFLIIAIAGNLLFICIFKYSEMFVQTTNHLFGLSLSVPYIELPIGISFYTFQAMSYVIDVYRGEVKPQKNYFNVLLYISFFPQLIAGPIVKYKDIAFQIESRTVTLNKTMNGIIRFCSGLAKKVLIANTMGNIVDTVYSLDYSDINIAISWIAAFCYLLQIYFDFSAYSDMAIGLAEIFGFKFKENFNYPYISCSIKEFGRRGHISLSTWFRDYLYIPLGGNRKGKLRASLNKIIVFICCGLWHGANWTFAIGGLIHGLFLLFEDYVNIKRIPGIFRGLYTMLAVTLLFVIFRSDDIFQAGFMFCQMFSGGNFELTANQIAFQFMSPLNIFTFFVAWLIALGFGSFIKKKFDDKISEKYSLYIKFVFCFMLLIICILTLSSGGYNPFIYFKF